MPHIPRHVALQYSLLINAVRVRTFIPKLWTYLVSHGVPFRHNIEGVTPAPLSSYPFPEAT